MSGQAGSWSVVAGLAWKYKANLMKNLLLRLINLFRRQSPKSTTAQLPPTYSRKGQGDNPHPSPAWKKIGILLDTQSRVHAMDEGERRNLSTSMKPESLDMALRELRLAERSAMNGLQKAEVISGDVLNEAGGRKSQNTNAGDLSQTSSADDIYLPEKGNV